MIEASHGGPAQPGMEISLFKSVGFLNHRTAVVAPSIVDWLVALFAEIRFVNVHRSVGIRYTFRILSVTFGG